LDKSTKICGFSVFFCQKLFGKKRRKKEKQVNMNANEAEYAFLRFVFGRRNECFKIEKDLQSEIANPKSKI
jgi:hypothetical protein